MNNKLGKNEIERFSRQIILKNIGSLGQQKIIKSKVLIIGMGGLGCPVAEFPVWWHSPSCWWLDTIF